MLHVSKTDLAVEAERSQCPRETSEDIVPQAGPLSPGMQGCSCYTKFWQITASAPVPTPLGTLALLVALMTV